MRVPLCKGDPSPRLPGLQRRRKTGSNVSCEKVESGVLWLFTNLSRESSTSGGAAAPPSPVRYTPPPPKGRPGGGWSITIIVWILGPEWDIQPGNGHPGSLDGYSWEGTGIPVLSSPRSIPCAVGLNSIYPLEMTKRDSLRFHGMEESMCTSSCIFHIQ